VARIGEERNLYTMLAAKPERKRHLEDKEAYIGRWDPNESSRDWLGDCRVDLFGSGLGPESCCCKHGDECLGSGATDLVSFIRCRVSSPS
jgi:hypothetical protein